MSTLADSYVVSGLVFQKDTERMANKSYYPHTQEGRQERMH